MSILAGVVSAERVAGEASDSPESALLMLRKGDLELGILPKVGGSAVLFRRNGGENALYAPSEHWLEWEARIPDPLDLSQWTDFFGHIIWLSPQVDFWNQQELIPQQHDQLWPPDPYWVYGDFKIIEKSENSVVLEGPASPYTGVKMIKRYSLDEQGAKLSVTAINTSSEVLHWGLWSNTRVSGQTEVYVPVKNENSFRIETPEMGAIPWSVEDHFFHFSSGIAEGESSPYAKAYLFPDAHWMAGFQNEQVFVKIMEPVLASEIHENHGIFEVYHLRPNSHLEQPGLTEMEGHGAYHTIKPGDKITLSERWMIFPQELHGIKVQPLRWLSANRDRLGQIEVD